jgi:hypothetical protein
LAALFKNTVMVWDIKTGKMMSSFNTILDFGGTRLAVANKKDIFIAGDYQRNGVAGYQISDGYMVWHRNDLKNVQNIWISPDDEMAICIFEYGISQVLELSSGDTIKTIRGLNWVAFNKDNNWVALFKNSIEILEHLDNRIKNIKNVQSGRMLDSFFGGDYIIISPGIENPVSFIRLSDNNITIYQPQKGQHIVRLVYLKKEGKYVGVLLDYQKGEQWLIKFDLLKGEMGKVITSIGRPAAAEFCNDGDGLITSDGLFVDSSTGLFEKRFEFPTTEYP